MIRLSRKSIRDGWHQPELRGTGPPDPEHEVTIVRATTGSQWEDLRSVLLSKVILGDFASIWQSSKVQNAFHKRKSLSFRAESEKATLTLRGVGPASQR